MPRVEPRESSPATQHSLAIEVKGLVKRYNDRVVVDHLSFTVPRGEFFALLGPNGAGKTTTIEILEGYRRPDAGFVRVLGLDPWHDGHRLKPRIGVMLQAGGIYPTATPREVVELFAAFYPDPEDPSELLRLVGLEDVSQTRYRYLSGGQQRRLALALALIGKPELLFLDEPTTGMDPQARRLTWSLLEELKRRGITIVLTTHFLEEAERLADRVAIIDHGRLLVLATPQELMRLETDQITLTASQDLELAALQQLPSVRRVRELGNGRYALETDRPMDTLVELTSWARAHGILLTEVRVGYRSLEDVFLRLTGDDLRE
ncbi:MAG: ABC transporter ATP-binding protein [Thermomicrobium sp.]|nr:ABC transporter ATP-binding protein [Thermomicrobium sp.]MDW8007147.1 ABC transporter ATP-binding protein [Thermomicrobium sp.]